MDIYSRIVLDRLEGKTWISILHIKRGIHDTLLTGVSDAEFDGRNTEEWTDALDRMIVTHKRQHLV